MVNPTIQGILYRIGDFFNFDQLVVTLTLNPTGNFYDLIAHSQKLFPTKDDTSQNKENLCNNG